MKSSTKVVIATLTAGAVAAITFNAVQRRAKKSRARLEGEGVAEVAVAVDEMVNEGAPTAVVPPVA